FDLRLLDQYSPCVTTERQKDCWKFCLYFCIGSDILCIASTDKGFDMSRRRLGCRRDKNTMNGTNAERGLPKGCYRVPVFGDKLSTDARTANADRHEPLSVLWEHAITVSGLMGGGDHA